MPRARSRTLGSLMLVTPTRTGPSTVYRPMFSTPKSVYSTLSASCHDVRPYSPKVLPLTTLSRAKSIVPTGRCVPPTLTVVVDLLPRRHSPRSGTCLFPVQSALAERSCRVIRDLYRLAVDSTREAAPLPSRLAREHHGLPGGQRRLANRVAHRQDRRVRGRRISDSLRLLIADCQRKRIAGSPTSRPERNAVRVVVDEPIRAIRNPEVRAAGGVVRDARRVGVRGVERQRPSSVPTAS